MGVTCVTNCMVIHITTVTRLCSMMYSTPRFNADHAKNATKSTIRY